jgi:uncharacterized protein
MASKPRVPRTSGRRSAGASKPTAQVTPIRPGIEPQPKRRLTVQHVAAVAAMLQQKHRDDMREAAMRNPWQIADVSNWVPGVLAQGMKGMAGDDSLSTMYSGMTASAWADTGAAAWLGYPYLAELAVRPEYRRMTEAYARESTRKWLKFSARSDADKADKVEQIEEFFDQIRVRDHFHKASLHDGFFGRGQIHLDLGNTDDDDEMRLPLRRTPTKIRRGSLKALVNVEPMWSYPQRYNSTSPLKPDFYRPNTWQVMGKEVHTSRMLNFVSRPVSNILLPAYAFGGLSLSQIAKPYVDNFLRTRQSISDLVHSFNVPVLHTDLIDNLGDPQDGTGTLDARIMLFNLLRDNRDTLVLDKESEDFTQVSAPLSGLDKLQAQAIEQLSSVSGVPLVILLGITPSGLNTSTEGEITAWGQTVKAYQEFFYGPQLDTLVEIAQLSLWGEIDREIVYQFVPLAEMSEADKASIRKTNADTAMVYIDGGIIAPEEERARLAQDEDSLWSNIDPDDMPEPPPEDDMGGEGGEGGEAPPSVAGGGVKPTPKPAAPAPKAAPTIGSGAGANDDDPDLVYGPVAGDEWVEGDHPRDDDGKFGSGGTGGAGGQTESHTDAPLPQPAAWSKLKSHAPMKALVEKGIADDTDPKAMAKELIDIAGTVAQSGAANYARALIKHLEEKYGFAKGALGNPKPKGMGAPKLPDPDAKPSKKLAVPKVDVVEEAEADAPDIVEGPKSEAAGTGTADFNALESDADKATLAGEFDTFNEAFIAQVDKHIQGMTPEEAKASLEGLLEEAIPGTNQAKKLKASIKQQETLIEEAGEQDDPDAEYGAAPEIVEGPKGEGDPQTAEEQIALAKTKLLADIEGLSKAEQIASLESAALSGYPDTEAAADELLDELNADEEGETDEALPLSDEEKVAKVKADLKALLAGSTPEQQVDDLTSIAQNPKESPAFKQAAAALLAELDAGPKAAEPLGDPELGNSSQKLIKELVDGKGYMEDKSVAEKVETLDKFKTSHWATEADKAYAEKAKAILEKQGGEPGAGDLPEPKGDWQTSAKATLDSSMSATQKSNQLGYLLEAAKGEDKAYIQKVIDTFHKQQQSGAAGMGNKAEAPGDPGSLKASLKSPKAGSKQQLKVYNLAKSEHPNWTPDKKLEHLKAYKAHFKTAGAKAYTQHLIDQVQKHADSGGVAAPAPAPAQAAPAGAQTDGHIAQINSYADASKGGSPGTKASTIDGVIAAGSLGPEAKAHAEKVSAALKALTPHPSSAGQKKVYAAAQAIGTPADKKAAIDKAVGDEPSSFPPGGYSAKFADKWKSYLDGNLQTEDLPAPAAKAPPATPAPTGGANKVTAPQNLTRIKKAEATFGTAKKFVSANGIAQQAVCPSLASSFWDKVKPAERSAVKAYTGSAYTSINKALRPGAKGLDHDALKQAYAIDEAFEAEGAEAAQDFIVRRGENVPEGEIEIWKAGLAAGQPVTYSKQGFTSTSMSGKEAFSGKSVSFEICVRKGTKALGAYTVSSHTSENEILLGHGQPFEVLSIEQVGHQHIVRMITK